MAGWTTRSHHQGPGQGRLPSLGLATSDRRPIATSPECGGSAKEHLVDTSLPVVAKFNNLSRIIEVRLSLAAIVGADSEFLSVPLDQAVKEPEPDSALSADLMGAAPGNRPAG